MKTINQLTEDQFTELLDQYYAQPEKRSKLSRAEIKELATKLNSKIDVPLVAETQEQKILIKIVMKIDNFLYDNLPNEFYDLVRSLDSGIDDTEAKRLVKRLSKLANQKIDIPYIPENMEFIAISWVIGMFVNAARRDWDMDKAKSLSGDIGLHDSISNDEEYESLILM